MANKEKEAEGADENAEAAGEAAPSQKGFGKILAKLKNKKVLMIAAPALLLILGGCGAGAYFFLIQHAFRGAAGIGRAVFKGIGGAGRSVFGRRSFVGHFGRTYCY